MIDTVRLVGPWPGKRNFLRSALVTLAAGVKVKADSSGTYLRWAECSLPRVLFGHNGRVIQSQTQLDDALDRARSILAEHADIDAVEKIEASQIDLVWNFPIPAVPIILAHGGLRIPTIRGGPTRYPDDIGISWGRGRYACRVKFYDKCRQSHVSGSVLRVEITLRRGRIRREFSSQDWRDFQRCYRVFRNILLSIPSITVPARSRTLVEAVAQQPLTVREDILARLAQTKSARALRRYRRRFAAAYLAPNERFSWADVLPSEYPPNPAHVDAKQRRRIPEAFCDALCNSARWMRP